MVPKAGGSSNDKITVVLSPAPDDGASPPPSDDGRLPPQRLSVSKKESSKREKKHKQHKVADRDDADEGHSLLGRFIPPTLSEELKSVKCFKPAAWAGVTAGVAIITAAVLLCPGERAKASFVLAELSGFLAIFSTLPLIVSELRAHPMAAKHAHLDSLFAIHLGCALLSIVYFLEGNFELGMVGASSFSLSAVLIFLAWGESVYYKREKRKRQQRLIADSV